MSKKRRQHSPELKVRVGLEALKGIEPVHAIAAKYQVHPVQVSQWKKEMLERLPEVFARKAPTSVAEAAEREARLYQKIGQLEWNSTGLKKNLRSSTAERRKMIEPAHPRIATARQCQLLGLPRSTYYHRPQPTPTDDLAFMRQIDEVYLAHPEFGSRRWRAGSVAKATASIAKRVRRLMRWMGLEAILPEAELVAAPSGAPGVSVSAAESDGGAAQSGLGDGHHLYPDRGRVPVPVRRARLVIAGRSWLGPVEHARCALLRRNGAAGDRPVRGPGDLQHRPRLSVHFGRVYPAALGPRREALDGRQGPVPRQRLRRTPVAHGEMGRGLPEKLLFAGRCPRQPRPLLPLLQRRPAA